MASVYEDLLCLSDEELEYPMDPIGCGRFNI